MKAPLVRLLACLAVVPLLAGCIAEASHEPTASPMTYSCCETADIEKLYQPGQTFTLHWIVGVRDASATVPPRVELQASLTGPYATEAELKDAEMGVVTVPGLVTYTAEPVRPAGTPDEQPVSVIPIAPAAKPGYYNLASSMVDGDATASGASIIRIVAGS
ncbi:hypothetical protein GCM10011608_17090 [Micromonospora sonchi]|uniref:Lipoprotein n=1 Tax=Micromonospora sonchi TaxID=1763543 RepID=A0A917TR88_9ACTN|nr:hypothetical protein [Micromonospora sonchi]GGM33177.1 hypothetical protein GCM10011608_17090 [Micromonospora sonchi]